MVSTKFHQGFDDDMDDPFNSISDWASYGGIKCDRLRELELTFLNAIVSCFYKRTPEFSSLHLKLSQFQKVKCTDLQLLT